MENLNTLNENTQESMESMQDRLATLIAQKEQLLSQLKLLKPEMEMLMSQLGIGSYFQRDGVVYKIEQPKGTFVEFKTIDYNRTRKEGEKGGNYLSKKEAQEMGFNVKE